jgi:hypothetical protein
MLEVSQAFEVSRAISHGWAGVKRQPVGLLLGSLLLTMTEGGGGNPMGGGNYGDSGSSSDHKSIAMPTDLWSEKIRSALGDTFDLHTAAGVAALLVALTCALLCVAAVVLFRCWIEAGYLRTHRDLVISGHADTGTLFSGASDVFRLLFWKLLSGVVIVDVLAVAVVPALASAGVAYGLHAEENTILGIAVLVALPFVLPTMFYVGIGLAFGDRAVVIDGLGPVAALDRSWSLAKNNRIQLFVFLFVTRLFWFLGIFLCCIGIVLTRAIVEVGTTEAYMLATQSNTEAWVLPKLP